MSFETSGLKESTPPYFLLAIKKKIHIEKSLDPLSIKMARFVYRFVLLCVVVEFACYRYSQTILIYTEYLYPM